MIDHRQVGSHARILVVDDDKMLRYLTREVLETAGFHVTEASNGAEAVDRQLATPFDLILMDVEMPLMDGFQACQTLRGIPDGAHVPIVMATGLEDNASIDRAFEVGATDFISKPVNMSLLPHRVRYVLRAAQANVNLATSEAKNRALINSMPDTIMVVDPQGTIEFCSGASENDAAALAVGANVIAAIPAAVRPELERAIHNILQSKSCKPFEFDGDDGQSAYECRVLSYVQQRALVILRDFSEKRSAEREIHTLAYFDGLTGLPNRVLFQRQLQNLISAVADEEERFALLYIDLDGFKRINDTLGHSVGDSLIQSVAERLKSCIRLEDQVVTNTETGLPKLARLGGDEFVLVVRHLQGKEGAGTVAQRIREALMQAFEHEGHEFVVTPSIGIAMFPEDGEDLDTLLKNADTAMYQAKAAGRNAYRFYKTAMNATSLDRLDLESDLRRAVANGDLRLVYQPKTDLKTRQTAGFEALLRWEHPQRGLVYPGNFIPIAEESGLIVEIGEWVIFEAPPESQIKGESPIDRTLVRVAHIRR